VDLLAADVVAAYERYEFGRVMSGIHNFCAIELSKFYLDAIKDRMYCDGKDWPSRRSGQAACHRILVRLLKLLAPVLPHTAEEVWQRVPGAEGSIHVQTFEVPDAARLEEIEASDLQVRFAAILGERGDAFAVHEAWKQIEGNPKDSQDAVLTVRQTGTALDLLRTFSPEELALFFKVSWVTLEEGEESYEYAPSPYLKCERSRLRRPDVEEVEIDGRRVPLSARDRRAIGLNP
jgi:isoleucyl-tRNA synthetase